jgi:hypothetical protein
MAARTQAPWETSLVAVTLSTLRHLRPHRVSTLGLVDRPYSASDEVLSSRGLGSCGRSAAALAALSKKRDEQMDSLQFQNPNRFVVHMQYRREQSAAFEAELTARV